ncbi:MAG: PTS system, sucrose-specific IIBC component, partial [Halanaerobium sp.]
RTICNTVRLNFVDSGNYENYKYYPQQTIRYNFLVLYNVDSVDCTIRLRLVLKDKTKSDQKAVENIDGVKGAFVNSGQFQIIIGQGSVNSVLNG